MNTFEKDKEYIAATYGRFPLEIVGGRGSLVLGGDGREYIDLGTGIAVNTFGVCDGEWIEAVTAQLNKFQHTSNLYYSEPCAALAELLCQRTGMKKVFFCNSGAEANECAFKIARKYGEITKGKDCYTVITLKNSFHGRTITTLSATGQDVFHEHFKPMTEGFVFAEANNLESVERLLDENKVAAIMIEPVQGEGGVLPLEKEFVKGLREIADRENILLMCDEVQTGNGRTGRLYAFEHFGVRPDVITTAKGLGGGLPIGAAMLGEKVENIFTPGMNGSTFGGNPVVCAGAYSILSRLDEELLASVREKSEYIKSALVGAKGVRSVSGLGLMLGIETERSAKDVVRSCMDRGVLVITAKTRVRLLPALNIPFDLLVKAVDILKEACSEGL